MSGKSDTSSGNISRIIKNPLLNASVTGLSVDDISQNIFLLPAAAPVVEPTPAAVIQPSSTFNNNTTDHSFANNPSAPSFEDTFSEISLDPTLEPVEQYRTFESPTNPLLDTTDINHQGFQSSFDQQNNNSNQGIKVTSLFPVDTAQHLAESLSILPNVASTVFSSFSSFIKGHRLNEDQNQQQSTVLTNTIDPNRRESNSFNWDPSIQSSYGVNAIPEQLAPNNNEVITGPPPVFYDPTEPIRMNKEQCPPPIANPSNSGNQFRLNSRKKIYAPVPGLIANNNFNNFDDKSNQVQQQGYISGANYNSVQSEFIVNQNQTVSYANVVPNNFASSPASSIGHSPLVNNNSSPVLSVGQTSPLNFGPPPPVGITSQTSVNFGPSPSAGVNPEIPVSLVSSPIFSAEQSPSVSVSSTPSINFGSPAPVNFASPAPVTFGSPVPVNFGSPAPVNFGLPPASVSAGPSPAVSVSPPSIFKSNNYRLTPTTKPEEIVAVVQQNTTTSNLFDATPTNNSVPTVEFDNPTTYSSLPSDVPRINNNSDLGKDIIDETVFTKGTSSHTKLNQTVPFNVNPEDSLINDKTSTGVEDILTQYGNFDEIPDNVLYHLMSMDFSKDPQLSVPATSTPMVYRPIYKHWFYQKSKGVKDTWEPFSMTDSLEIEEAHVTQGKEIVHTDGGRYDVNMKTKERIPVYWTAEPNIVRRCSWFYKTNDGRYIPFEEDVSDLLENEYMDAITNKNWNRKIDLPQEESIIFQGPSLIVYFSQPTTNPNNWNNTTIASSNRPKIVKRGIDEFNIDDGEPEVVDHLLFMVHGIGAFCDLKFRTVEEVVDDFRNIALNLVQSHYRSSCDTAAIGRVEVLPVSWHSQLHSAESGIDEKLKSITLESIPKLRSFANETVLDVLFYTSPVFCQSILKAVANSINELHKKFLERNPNFKGNVSLSGHSLGSTILFDLLSHQNERIVDTQEEQDNNTSMQTASSFNYGRAGTGQPFVIYPQLNFNVKHFFALGSPTGMFITVRGIDFLGMDFKLPTCENFYNIFHPYDPIAYRMEALINPSLSTLRPVLIPHHKGRKRMHLELKETMTRVGGEIKQKIVNTFKNTMATVYGLTSSTKTDPNAITDEVDKVLEEQMQFNNTGTSDNSSQSNSPNTSGQELEDEQSVSQFGIINRGRRIDYVLQEAPIEFFNEYLFALTSHVCYWESEDTTLFIMKAIYSSMGIQPDNKIPQGTLVIEKPTSPSE